jgi:hypothetical protein
MTLDLVLMEGQTGNETACAYSANNPLLECSETWRSTTHDGGHCQHILLKEYWGNNSTCDGGQYVFQKPMFWNCKRIWKEPFHFPWMIYEFLSKGQDAVLSLLVFLWYSLIYLDASESRVSVCILTSADLVLTWQASTSFISRHTCLPTGDFPRWIWHGFLQQLYHHLAL